jgi:predicted esterase
MGPTAPLPEYFIHAPRQPGPLLVALHGFGESGHDVARWLLPLIEHRGWLLVAPTFAYRDLVDPVDTQVDDVTFAHDLRRVIASVSQLQSPRDGRALIFGFSRGASLAQRFAVFFPSLVTAVAAFAGGAYTLPQPSVALEGGASLPLSLPLGTGDYERWFGEPMDAKGLKGVPFWLGVGENDDDPLTLPSQYDAMLGSTRVERAKSCARALRAFGAEAELVTFPNTGHELTPAVVEAAVHFLASWT